MTQRFYFTRNASEPIRSIGPARLRRAGAIPTFSISGPSTPLDVFGVSDHAVFGRAGIGRPWPRSLIGSDPGFLVDLCRYSKLLELQRVTDR
jgi:hypothetical protein